MTPGQLIRLARRERGISQGELAARLGVHRNTVGAWEREISHPPLAMLGPLCAALGLDSRAFAELPRYWRRYLRD